MAAFDEDAEIAELMESTRFTEIQLKKYYEYANEPPFEAGQLDQARFEQLSMDEGLTNPRLIGRLWDVMDSTDDGAVTVKELVELLNALTRGTLDDVTHVFFRVYDINHDGEIDMEELVEVYGALVYVSSGVDQAELTPEQTQALRNFAAKADADSDLDLDYAEFAAAVKRLVEKNEEASAGLCTPRALLLVFLTSFFELGTSLACQAMGALAVQLQYRFRDQATDEPLSDSGIGALAAGYYAGAMFGPMFGGQVLLRIGPIKTVIMANCIVTVFCLVQALADGEDNLWLMMVARFGIGFGGLITPFCTLECLCKLFPDDFMLMAGIRNLVQSASGFFAFVVLPWIQRTYLSEDTLALNAEDFDGSVSLFSAEQDDPDYNHGTTMALHFCFFCGILSLISNVTVYLCFMKDGAAGDLPVQKDLAAQVRGLAGAITPKSPSSCDQWKLPLSFYIAIYGIQSQYFAPFSFSSFSNKIYMNRYGANAATASFYSGVMNLIGGLVGPILGPVSDAYGNRALMLGGFGVLSAIGFALIGSSSEINLWIPTILFALQYGFGDTVACKPHLRPNAPNCWSCSVPPAVLCSA
jgi:Ca2+-binding EF-hand superfamily protein/MFS family permease